jgi:hypothetical protein
MKFISKLFAVSALLAAAQANALVIDFGSAAWTSPAHGQNSYNVGNVTVSAYKLDANKETINAKLFAADKDDGLGVLAGEDDEIDGTEWLEIVFTNAVSLENLSVSDFFPATNEKGRDGSDPIRGEVGYIQLFWGALDLGTTTIYGQDSIGLNGEQTIAFNGAGVTKIKLWADPALRYTAPLGRNEFSVKSIEVPEPGIFALLGLGLMGLGLSRRRLAKKA